MRFFRLVSGSVRPSRQIVQTSMPSRRVDGMVRREGAVCALDGSTALPPQPEPVDQTGLSWTPSELPLQGYLDTLYGRIAG